MSLDGLAKKESPRSKHERGRGQLGRVSRTDAALVAVTLVTRSRFLKKLGAADNPTAPKVIRPKHGGLGDGNGRMPIRYRMRLISQVTSASVCGVGLK